MGVWGPHSVGAKPSGDGPGELGATVSCSWGLGGGAPGVGSASQGWVNMFARAGLFRAACSREWLSTSLLPIEKGTQLCDKAHRFIVFMSPKLISRCLDRTLTACQRHMGDTAQVVNLL